MGAIGLWQRCGAPLPSALRAIAAAAALVLIAPSTALAHEKWVTEGELPEPRA